MQYPAIFAKNLIPGNSKFFWVRKPAARAIPVTPTLLFNLMESKNNTKLRSIGDVRLF